MFNQLIDLSEIKEYDLSDMFLPNKKRSMWTTRKISKIKKPVYQFFAKSLLEKLTDKKDLLDNKIYISSITGVLNYFNNSSINGKYMEWFNLTFYNHKYGNYHSTNINDKLIKFNKEITSKLKTKNLDKLFYLSGDNIFEKLYERPLEDERQLQEFRLGLIIIDYFVENIFAKNFDYRYKLQNEIGDIISYNMNFRHNQDHMIVNLMNYKAPLNIKFNKSNIPNYIRKAYKDIIQEQKSKKFLGIF